MYRNGQLRAYQYFLATDWSGGVYGSPTLAGSRPGALMVGCWATLVKMGRQGYLQSAKEIVGAAMKLKHAIQEKEIEGLYVLGDPIGSVVAFSSDKVNIYEVADSMAQKGWHLSALQNPAALHVACTRLTAGYIDDLIRDLKATVKELISTDSNPSSEGTAALYGVAGSIQTVGVVDRIVEGFLDNLYKL